jgi:hypothetical protein
LCGTGVTTCFVVTVVLAPAAPCLVTTVVLVCAVPCLVTTVLLDEAVLEPWLGVSAEELADLSAARCEAATASCA